MTESRGIKAAPQKKKSLLQKVVHAGPANSGPAAVLFQGGVQESEQGLAAGAVAGEAGEPKLLERAGEEAKSQALARKESGLLAPGIEVEGTLQDDIAPPPSV